MVNAQAVQDGGLQVVDVDRIFEDVVAVVVGLAEGMPGLMPPPAIHMVKQRGWWSRPFVLKARASTLRRHALAKATASRSHSQAASPQLAFKCSEIPDCRNVYRFNLCEDHIGCKPGSALGPNARVCTMSDKIIRITSRLSPCFAPPTKGHIHWEAMHAPRAFSPELTAVVYGLHRFPRTIACRPRVIVPNSDLGESADGPGSLRCVGVVRRSQVEKLAGRQNCSANQPLALPFRTRKKQLTRLLSGT